VSNNPESSLPVEADVQQLVLPTVLYGLLERMPSGFVWAGAERDRWFDVFKAAVNLISKEPEPAPPA